MKNLKILVVIFIALTFLIIYSCANDDGTISTPTTLPETEVVNIPLAGPAADIQREYSGLAWLEDKLILLTQYPFEESDSSNDNGIMFSIPKERIISFLDGTDESPIIPDTFRFSAHGLEKYNSHGSGYEAITFAKGYCFVSIESNLNDVTTGNLVKGYGANGVDASTLVTIQSQSGVFNFSEEAIFNFDGRIYAIHEANGKNVNPNPVSHSYHLNLADEITVPFPNIEYRITDATTPDDTGKFWVINYFWEGDSSVLKPVEDDDLVKKYGIGETNANMPGIERLIQLQVTADGIQLVDRAPIYLKLNNDGGRNWEGIAQLDDRGLLIVTDKFPSTILGFVEF